MNTMKIGGLRLNIKGKASKQQIIETIEELLTSLSDNFEAKTFGGINLYIQMYESNDKRMALIGSDGSVIDGIVTNEHPINLDFLKNGYTTMPVNEVVRQIEDEEKRREKARQVQFQKNSAERDRIYRKDQAIKQEMALFRKFLCEKYNVASLKEVMGSVISSIGRLVSESAILKYIDKDDIPDYGYVFRATLKDKTTGKPSTVLIYDKDFNQITTIT